MNDELKGCPCCQQAACILEVECGDDDNFGGKYIECQNPQCGITSPIIFPCMESVEDKLTAIWNARPSPAISEDDEHCSKREGICGCTENECRRHIVIDDGLREAIDLFNQTGVFLLPENKKYKDALNVLITHALKGQSK